AARPRRSRRSPSARRLARARVLHGDDPEDSEVLHPLRSFDQRTNSEAIGTRTRWSDDGELEPRDLVRPHPLRGLRGHAVVSRPASVWRSGRAVSAEHRTAVLTWLGVPRSEVCDLTHGPQEPAARAAVVVGDDRGRGLTGAETRGGTLPEPRCMEAGDARGDFRGRRDTRAVGALARRGRR